MTGRGLRRLVGHPSKPRKIGLTTQMLVQALAEKRRALVVLDDPWVPEQVRLLNPIDGSHTQHRLLITTRMRDLVRDFRMHVVGCRSTEFAFQRCRRRREWSCR